MDEFIITRIYADHKGDTHFEDISVPLISSGPIGYLSQKFPVKSLIFRQVNADYDYEFHTAPERQFIILLDGEIEIESSLGEKRRFAAGDVLKLEDVSGKGHRTRNLKPIKRRSIFITF